MYLDTRCIRIVSSPASWKNDVHKGAGRETNDDAEWLQNARLDTISKARTQVSETTNWRSKPDMTPQERTIAWH